MKRTRSWTAVVVALGIASASNAQVVVPNSQAGTASGTSGLNTFIRDVGAPRTGQLLISSSQLGGINIGDTITGISFRMYANNTTGFPASAATYADYEIRIGVGVAMGTQTTTFATNFASPPTLVRDGPLTITPFMFPAGNTAPNPTPFASPTPFEFQTPYVYTGGNLLIELTHTGSDITNPAGSFLQTVPSDVNNYWSATATTFQATTGTAAAFTVAQVNFTPVPEPTSIALVGAASLVAAVWRRRKEKS